MADITVDVNLPNAISVDVTSPTQALATNISIPGPQGPRGPGSNINGLTPELLYITGRDGIIVSSNNVDTIFISGNSGYFQSAVNSLTTNLNSTGNTLNIKIDNLSGYVDTQDSNISNNLASTGSSLQININTLSSNLSSTGSNLNDKINSLSGTLTGNYLTSSSASNTYATISNLALTGSNLNTKIDNFSGTYQNFVDNLDSSYATDVQLQNTGSTLSQNINSLSGALTGNYYLKSNPSGFITGVDLSSYLTSSSASTTYATIINLASTGSTLTSSINSLNSAFTGFTGNLDTTYATDSQLISTGSTLVNSISSLSGTLTSNYATINNLNSTGSTLEANIASTGNTLNLSINSLSGTLTSTYATITNLASTGSTLNNSINSLSGTLTSTYATINNLASTGSTLQSNINTLTNNLNSTGNTLDNKIGSLSGTLTSTYATISNLASTGSTLNTKINDLSGYVNTQDNSISNNLIFTGNTLQNSINSLSGSSVLLYGDQSVGGIKTFRDNVYINNLYVTGTETIVNTAQINLASNYLLLNITGGAVDGGIFFVTGSGLTGVNDTGPIIGFDHVNKFKFGISTRNSDLSTLPDIASVQDIIAYSGVADNKFSTIINLASTGNTLEQKISSLSGTLTSNYATISNLSSTGSTLQSNINTVASNLITTGNTLQNNINTVSSNLISTGNTLEGKISSLSGTLTSNYATITNLALTGSTLVTNLASTGSTLNSSINSLSGTLTSNYATIINLASTGSTLNSNINSLSGTLTANYATISNLASTGSTLVGSINSLSGTLTSTYATISNLASTGSTLAANLASTGSTLQTNINNLSGYTNSTFATITNLASTGSTLTTNLINTGSTLDTKINNLSGYINSTSSNIVFTTGNQTINGNKSFTSSSVLTVKTISGFQGSSPETLNLIAANDNTVVSNVNLAGNINLTAGTGTTFGTSTYGNINLNAGGPKYDGTINLNGNINLNSTNSTLLSSRSINIYKTGLAFGSPTAINGLTIDNNNISLSTPLGGGAGFGLLISGVLVTPALYATSANLASTGNTLVTNLASTGSTLVNTINSLSGTLTGNYATITNLASTGSTLNTTINNLSGYINSTSSNIVFTTGNQNIAGNKTLTNKLNITANATSDSALKVGTLEFQPYAVNNAWFGDNTYYSGGFYRREAGYAGAFYFQGAEGQFRFANTDDAGTSYTPVAQLKINLDGKFGVGSNIETTTDDFTNSKFFVDSNGDVGINTVDPTEKLQVNGNIKFGDPAIASATLYMYDAPNDEYNTATWTDSELQLTQISNSSTLVISFAPEYNTLISNGSYLKLPSGKNDYIAMDAEVVHRTGIETISGVKTFASRPTVNGTGVLLSGEAAQVDLSTTVRTTGNQTVSGVKDFQSVPLVSGREVYYQKNIVYSTGNNFTPDSNLARTFEYVLTGLAGASATLNAPINMSNGENIVIKIKQSPSGSNNMIFNAAYKFPGGVSPSLTLTPSRADVYTILKIDSNFYSTYVKDFVN
jgi:hypothetical protein